MISAVLLEKCVAFAQQWSEARGSLEGDIFISPTTTASTAFSSLGLGGNAPSSASSYEDDPHAVSQVEAISYYAGLPSEPTLVYRTGKPWSSPSGPEAQRRIKELRPVFEHRVVALWTNGLSDEVVEILDFHKVSYRHFAVLWVLLTHSVL